jgi:hypothetical protein
MGMLLCGLLVPMHLRAVDASVLQRAGRATPGVVERGLALVDQKNLGAALMLSQAALEADLPGREKLAAPCEVLATNHPEWAVLGCEEARLQRLFAGTAATASEPFTELIIRQENRGRVLEALRGSTKPGARELVQCRSLTNTVFFPASTTSSGQAFDAALSICGLLVEEGKLTPGLSNAIHAAAAQASGEADVPTASAPTEALEQVLLDLMSLGQRFNWGQLEVFTAQITDAETLRLLAAAVRKADGQLPILFSAVALSGRPAEVARYLVNFSQTGLTDLGAGLCSGTGGVRELLARNQRLYHSSLRQGLTGHAPFSVFSRSVADCCWLMPAVALVCKWLLYLVGGVLLAAAVHFSLPPVPALERPLEVRGFHLARELLFGLGFLLVVVLWSEPFLSEESQKVEFSFRLRLPIMSGAASAGLANATTSIMQFNLMTLLLFFVIQGLIYTACLVKLAEIRRQRVPARVKLKLLDNEDHLFDAGLYVGFAGTIISLILVSQGIVNSSLMAAYSSTSFGIIFVVIFKIFHLRPLRRTYLLEAEALTTEPAVAAPSAVAPAAPIATAP